MKKLKCLLALFVYLFALTSVVHPQTTKVSAESATSYTFVEDTHESGQVSLIYSQDAYLPKKALTDLTLRTPTDVLIDKNDNIYICDSGNRKIVVYDGNQIINTITNPEFRTPKGIFIDANDKLYVADTDAFKIFVYDIISSTEIVYSSEIVKPNSIYLANQDFKPSKVSVDTYGNIYIICDNIYDGIMQLSKDGSFAGYYATNKVVKSFKEKLQEWIYDEDTYNSIIGTRTPPLFTNLFTYSNENLLYTTTSYSKEYSYLKKHDSSGKNILDVKIAPSSPTDIFVDNRGIIYVLSNTGHIYTYAKTGELLCIFGGKSIDDISGLFDSPTGICVDSSGNIWVVDSRKAVLQCFVPTDYTLQIFNALDAYYTRDYQQAITLWTRVLELNEMSRLAHNNLGLNYLYIQDYDLAMHHLKLANNKTFYSEAYWEVRNQWIQTNLIAVIVIVLIVIIGLFAVKKLHSKYNMFAVIYDGKEKINNYRLVKDIKFNFSIIKKPSDKFYHIKTNRSGSTKSCIILLLVTFLVYVINLTSKGFIYQNLEANEIDLFSVFVGFFGIFFLAVLSNYLVTSIQDGEGKFLAIFRMASVSLLPWMVSLIVTTLLSHVATLNEVFIIQIINYLGIGLTVYLFISGIQEVHFYSFKQTIISILLTILIALVVLLVVLLLIVLTNELIEFIEIIIKEVVRNVQA